MGRDRVLIGIDFDGVIAPLVATPDLSVPDPRVKSLLAHLTAHPGVDVAVVSGRALDDLALRLGEASGLTLIGEHGNDMGEKVSIPEVLREARRFVHELGEAMPGATVEDKTMSVAFHTRRLDGRQSTAASKAIKDWVFDREGVALLEGKEVYELTVATRTKGDAIRDLAGRVDGVAYLGDDLTDETVFECLEDTDVGIKVGPGETAARYRVADVNGVVEVLEWMTTDRVRADAGPCDE